MNKRIFLLIALGFILYSFSWSQTAVKPPGGGRDEDPYLVSTLEHLYYMHLNPEGGMFVQTADIDATATRYWDAGKGFNPIGSSSNPFRGGYDGNGHVIKGLYINRPEMEDVGLFGVLVFGSINRVGLINVNITGKNDVGGICGSINFTNPITRCFVTGTITGNISVGGLFGSINDTEVSYCYSSCIVKGGLLFTGGLTGINVYSVITNCYALGTVTGDKYVGGLVGTNMSGSGSDLALISSCYASVKVKGIGDSEPGALIGENSDFSIVSNSYWNVEIAGAIEGYGLNAGVFANCSALTSDQMKQSSNFTRWNFDGAWKIRSGQTYPALSLVADNAPFAFRDVISQHAAVFEILPLLSNDYDYETLQSNLKLKIIGLSAGSHNDFHIFFPASAHMGDTLTVTYKVGEVRPSHNDTLWGNTVSSLLIYSNQAPEITEVPSYSIQEDGHVSLSFNEITAYDPDNDPYTFRIFNGADYTVNGTVISPAANYNGVLRVGIGATDGSFMSDTAFIEVIVSSINDTPDLTNAYAKTMMEDSTLLISLDDVFCTDPDGDTLVLIMGEGSNYSIFDGVLSPLPDFNGNLSVPLRVTDGIDTSVAVIMSITVKPVNDAPVILSSAPLEATEDNKYTYTVNASDIDHTKLSFMLTRRPADMSISADGIISWIPDKGITTSGTVTLVVSDGEYNAIQTFIISVLTLNIVPAVRDTLVVTHENITVSVEMPAIDPDGTISSIVIDTDPVHGTTRRSGLTISYTPDANYTGNDSLTWYALDNEGAISAIARMIVVINEVNHAPEIMSTASPNATGGVLYTYTVIASDADGDNLSYSLSNQPSGMTIDESGLIHWLPGTNILATGDITLIVSDGVLEVTEVFSIAVNQTTAAATLPESELIVYPNPCRDRFTIDAGNKVTSLRIFSVDGNLIHMQPVQGNSQIDVSHLKNGTYVVNMDGFNMKLIKNE